MNGDLTIALGVQRLNLTPSILAALLEDGSDWLERSSLKCIVVGGEAADPSKLLLCRDRIPDLEIVNAYGPTEGTIRSTFFSVPQDHDLKRSIQLPIGVSVPNTSAFILDSESLLPVPPGIRGEIVIAGVHLARGYLNRTELTNEKFVVLPLDHPLGSIRIYRTGDVGYQTKIGLTFYAGRTDNQIKLRGQRVELGEIEHAILQYTRIQACVVTIVSSEANNGEQLSGRR